MNWSQYRDTGVTDPALTISGSDYVAVVKMYNLVIISAGRSLLFYLSMFGSEKCEQRSMIADHGIKSVNQTKKKKSNMK